MSSTYAVSLLKKMQCSAFTTLCQFQVHNTVIQISSIVPGLYSRSLLVIYLIYSKCVYINLPTKVHLVKAMVFPWSCMDVRVGL